MGLINKHEIWLMVYWIEKWKGICSMNTCMFIIFVGLMYFFFRYGKYQQQSVSQNI